MTAFPPDHIPGGYKKGCRCRRCIDKRNADQYRYQANRRARELEAARRIYIEPADIGTRRSYSPRHDARIAAAAQWAYPDDRGPNQGTRRETS